MVAAAVGGGRFLKPSGMAKKERKKKVKYRAR